VIENRAHDVSSFGLASIRILERTKPLLNSDRFDFSYAIASPPRQYPLSEIASVGDLCLPTLGAIRPQFLFPVVFDERVNTDRSQTGSRILSVDVCPKCGDGLLSRRLVRILFERSNHQIASCPAAIRLEFVPPVLPSFPATGTLHDLKAACLKLQIVQELLICA
jgi:hypothetical protein